MILTAEQMQAILEELRWETVVEPSERFSCRVQRCTGGYRAGVLGKAQAGLSIMLEAKMLMKATKGVNDGDAT